VFGYDAMSTAAEESRESQKHMQGDPLLAGRLDGALRVGLLAFVVVCVAVIVLRYRRPDLPRTFPTPGMPVVPLIGVGFSLWLISFLDR